MGKHCTQLSMEEGGLIQTQLEPGMKPAAIAAGLNRPLSTISRELARNGWSDRKCGVALAAPRVLTATRHSSLSDGKKACRVAPRVERRLRLDTALWRHVTRHLEAGPRATIITGSYNFTRSADRQNAENIVILSGNSSLARKFLNNYNRHRAQSSRLQ